MRETAREIDDAAAAWVARLDRGPLTGEQEQKFQAWLAGDSRRLGAFGRMCGFSLITERSSALGTDFNPADFTPLHSRRKLLRLGVASAAAAGIGGAVGLKFFFDAKKFQTTKGELKVIPLEDGSVVTLNTDSAVAVNYTDRLRSIQLYWGEALFDVAKSQSRPFTVAAGDTRITVVGTSFTVRQLESTPVQVLVREGIVEVSKPNRAEMKPIRISANNLAVAAQHEVGIAARPIAPSELHRALAWETGMIAFEGETLAEATAEFARYSDVKIMIEDEQLAREPITGLFRASDPVDFAEKIAISLDAKAKVGEGQVRIMRRDQE
jgi:transmembrane sensor